MYQANEALVRAHVRARQAEAGEAAVAVRYVRARRAQRRDLAATAR